MTNSNHPITPPPELVQKLADGPATWLEKISKAYCAGADQELEASCKALKNIGLPTISDQLQVIRRPKPPSIKEQALEALEKWAEDEYGPGAVFHKGLEVGLIRRALKALPD